MVNSTPNKTGRPTAIYTTRDGIHIVGLMRLADGRWRASGPEKFTFTEPDEGLAIARFREWQGRHENPTITVPLAGAKVGDMDAFRRAVAFVSPEPSPSNLPALGTWAPTTADPWTPGQQSPPAPAPTLRPGQPIRLVLRGDRLEFHGQPVDATAFWPWMRQLILDKPQYVAQMTGIEQIGYLADLPKPTPSPTLAEVGKLYLAHSKISDNWRAKCVLFWDEFVKSVEVVKLRDLTQEHVVKYADTIHETAKTATYARQRFGAIKAILNYPTKRGKWAEDCKRAIALCGVLVPPQKSAVDPHPIDVDAFHALYRAADAQMQAMLLLGLNCCMYGGEVAALDWSDIDLAKGTVSTSRSKTNVVRIAVLWPETLAALATVPKKTDAVFITSATKMKHNYQTLYKSFKTVRKAAKVPTVQFADVRDGSYTAAVEAGVDLNVCRLLAGHATGISDHYVMRRPTMVAAACEAIRQAYRIDTLP